MKIALLAPSGAGKTAYLTALYGQLKAISLNKSYGLRFGITNSVLQKKMDIRYHELQEGKFETASKEITTYKFKLSNPPNVTDGNIKTLNVEIIDFPGEDLSGSDEVRVQEVERIIAALSDCDGFIVLLDGEKIISSKNSRQLQTGLNATDIASVLYKALERRRSYIKTPSDESNGYAFQGGKTPIAFAVTKGDLLNDWLSKEGEDVRGELLKSKVKGLFQMTGDDENIYSEREGEIANFIRSQFGEIIDAKDILSIRTSVSTFNLQSQEYDPQNIEYLFQFVLFGGLLNAIDEYRRRKNIIQAKQGESQDNFESQKNYYERSVQARRNWFERSWLDRQLDNWFGDENENTHDNKVSRDYRDMSRAAEQLDAGKLSLSQVNDNLSTSKYFYQKILSDGLVYLLANGKKKGVLYQTGLPIKDLSTATWWQKKFSSGSNYFKATNV